MEKVIGLKYIGRHNSIADEGHVKTLLFIASFFVLNALKMTLFNFEIMGTHTIETFVYKLLFSMVTTLFIYIVILQFKKPYVFFTFYLLQSVYVFANLSYFDYFHNYLHIFQSAVLFSQGMGSVKHFSIPADPRLLILLIDLPVFICLFAEYSRLAVINTGLRLYKKYLLILSVFIIVYTEGWNYLHGISAVQIARDYSTGEPLIIQRYGTVINNLCDIIFNNGGKNYISHLKYGQTVANNSTAGSKPNFIAIQVESMDANVINQKYNDSYIAPFLHNLSQESIYYPYVLSYHKAGGTSDSEFSIINSVEPLGDFPSIKIVNYKYPNSMIRRLSNNSYNTIAFHGNVGAFYNRDVAFPNMGFKEFDDIKKMGYTDVGWGAPDNDVFNYAFNKLKGQTSPFFSYIITMTSHTPFTSARNYYDNSNYDNIQDERVKNYFNSISYVDQSIESFVQNVRANFKNTYIFIWGDHTPDINSDYYKQASFLDGSNYFEFVPMLIITPDSKVYKEGGKVASFLDISPTVLYTSGIQFKLKTDGENLINQAGSDQKIPFKGNEYTRNDLFNEISKQK